MFKIRGKIVDTHRLTFFLTDVETPSYVLKTQSLRLHNFISKRNFDTGFEISYVGILDISPYTKSELRRVAGNHITRLTKNGYAAVAVQYT